MDMTPGFYQGRQKGPQTGRVSPRDAIRPARADVILARHGIIDIGTVDPNQGQLFDSRQMEAVPDADILRKHNAPPPLPGGGHRGFMPGLVRSTPEAARKAKALAVQKLGESRVRTGASRGGPPVKETLEDRAAVYARGKEAPWYSHTGENEGGKTGEVRPGEASELISDAAMRQGVSHARMTRAVAITSPRTAWDDANDRSGHSGGNARPNLQSAESVVRTVKALPADTPLGSSKHPEPGTVKAIASSAYGKSLGDMKGKAGVEFHKGEPSAPIPIVDASSAKVPNFEQSLHLDHVSNFVKQQAARSYTVDVHDTTSFGGDEELLKSDTGYHVAAMTGRRAANKAGELAPNFQASTWNAIRDQAGPASVGQDRLFAAVPRGPRLGELHPNPKALPPVEEHKAVAADNAADDRSPQAKKFGTPF